MPLYVVCVQIPAIYWYEEPISAIEFQVCFEVVMFAV